MSQADDNSMDQICGRDLITDGWFLEKNPQWPGQAFGLKVDELLLSTKSKFQDVLVFNNKQYGNVLVLDGVIQCTEKDEFAYQEMLAHLPLNCHRRPKQVLIIGGGDGGMAREVAKHPDVEHITMCEIDDEVIDIAKEYLPYTSSGFQSRKLHLHIGDGFEFMEKHQNEFDVIISDTSDPVGPAERLFSEEYYRLVHGALKEDGVFAAQGESMWLHLPLIRDLLKFSNELFEKAAYASGYVPSYPCGQIGYLIASRDKKTSFERAERVFTEAEMSAMELRYYDEDVHRAAFVLPRSVKKALAIDGSSKAKLRAAEP